MPGKTKDHMFCLVYTVYRTFLVYFGVIVFLEPLPLIFILLTFCESISKFVCSCGCVDRRMVLAKQISVSQVCAWQLWVHA